MASSYTGYSSDVISRITRFPVRRRKSRTSACVAPAVRLPTTRLTTNRLSGSRATWSQQSPHRTSSGPQFFCFLATKAHFSSNCTSLVFGGKSDQFVVEGCGVVAGASGVPGDGVRVDASEPSGLAGADPFGDVSQNRSHLVRREPGVEQRSALAFGEAGLACSTAEHPAALPRPVPGGHGQVPVPPLPVVWTVEVQTAERPQVVHDRTRDPNRESGLLG